MKRLSLPPFILLSLVLAGFLQPAGPAAAEEPRMAPNRSGFFFLFQYRPSPENRTPDLLQKLYPSRLPEYMAGAPAVAAAAPEPPAPEAEFEGRAVDLVNEGPLAGRSRQLEAALAGGRVMAGERVRLKAGFRDPAGPEETDPSLVRWHWSPGYGVVSQVLDQGPEALVHCPAAGEARVEVEARDGRGVRLGRAQISFPVVERPELPDPGPGDLIWHLPDVVRAGTAFSAALSLAEAFFPEDYIFTWESGVPVNKTGDLTAEVGPASGLEPVEVAVSAASKEAPGRTLIRASRRVAVEAVPLAAASGPAGPEMEIIFDDGRLGPAGDGRYVAGQSAELTVEPAWPVDGAAWRWSAEGPAELTGPESSRPTVAFTGIGTVKVACELSSGGRPVGRTELELEVIADQDTVAAAAVHRQAREMQEAGNGPQALELAARAEALQPNNPFLRAEKARLAELAARRRAIALRAQEDHRARELAEEIKKLEGGRGRSQRTERSRTGLAGDHWSLTERETFPAFPEEPARPNPQAPPGTRRPDVSGPAAEAEAERPAESPSQFNVAGLYHLTGGQGTIRIRQNGDNLTVTLDTAYAQGTERAALNPAAGTAGFVHQWRYGGSRGTEQFTLRFSEVSGRLVLNVTQRSSSGNNYHYTLTRSGGPED